MYSIYSITDSDTRSIYIGCTSNFEQRVKDHENKRKGINWGGKSPFDIPDNGLNDPKYSVIDEVSNKKEAYSIERKWINFYLQTSDWNCLNTTNQGKKRDKSTCEKLSNIAKQRTGDKNPFYGRSHSEKTKNYLSKKFTGRFLENSSQNRSVSCENKIFPTVSSAARYYGVVPATICNRCKSKNYPDFFYTD